MNDWIPQFPGQRPPFSLGNQLGAGNSGPLKSGVWSPRHVEPIAKRIVKELRAECDWLRTPRFEDLVWRYARVRAQGELLDAYLETLTMDQACDSTDGRTSPLELIRQLGVRAANLAGRLGLTPLVPDDVQEQITAARKTLAARAARKALHDDLRASLREQVHGSDDPT